MKVAYWIGLSCEQAAQYNLSCGRVVGYKLLDDFFGVEANLPINANSSTL